MLCMLKITRNKLQRKQGHQRAKDILLYNSFTTHEAAYCYLNVEVDSLLIYIANSKAITERKDN